MTKLGIDRGGRKKEKKLYTSLAVTVDDETGKKVQVSCMGA